MFREIDWTSDLMRPGQINAWAVALLGSRSRSMISVRHRSRCPVCSRRFSEEEKVYEDAFRFSLCFGFDVRSECARLALSERVETRRPNRDRHGGDSQRQRD